METWRFGLLVLQWLVLSCHCDKILDSGYVFIEKAAHNHTGAIIVGRADPHVKHQVVLSLKQDLESLRKKLDRVSRLEEDEYGQYLAAEAASTLARPVDVSHLPVLEELSGIPGVEITKISPFGDYIHLKASVSILEVLFHTQFFVLRPSDEYLEFVSRVNADIVKNSGLGGQSGQLDTKSDGIHAIRAFQYSLPTALAAHIGVAFGTIQHPFAVNRANLFPQMSSAKPMISDKIDDLYTEYVKASKKNPALEPAYQPPIIGYVYPQLLESHYSLSTIDLGDFTDAIQPQIVFGGTNQYMSLADLNTFQKEFLQQEVQPSGVNDHLIEGPCTNPITCVESNLDMQYITAVSPQTPTIMWYEPDTSTSSFSLFLAAVNEMESPPGVISISYAMLESLLSSNDRYYFDVEASKLALRGVTIVAAAGDAGVAGLPSPLACGYNPLFPASSPFVTAVGGTFGLEFGVVEGTAEGDLGEPFTTGGGFSNVYKMPWWQHSSVKGYFDRLDEEMRLNGGSVNHVPYEDRSGASLIFHNKYSREGRGYPDISAASTNYIIVVNGSNYVVSGTSCAAPIFAGMVSLANLQRAVNGKGTVGWINPVLYSANVSVAIDIPTGNNKCYSLNQCCKQGFYSTFGWDPVTGLGAVDHVALHNVLVSLPFTLGPHTDPHSKDFDLTAGKVSRWWTVSSLMVIMSLCLLLAALRYISNEAAKRPDVWSTLCNSSTSTTPVFMSPATSSHLEQAPLLKQNMQPDRAFSSWWYGKETSASPPSASRACLTKSSNGATYTVVRNKSASSLIYSSPVKYGAVSACDGSDLQYDALAFAHPPNLRVAETGLANTKKTYVNIGDQGVERFNRNSHISNAAGSVSLFGTYESERLGGDKLGEDSYSFSFNDNNNDNL
jgi:hypothetical protein